MLDINSMSEEERVLCFPIEVSKDDSLVGQTHRTCINFVRAKSAPSLDCQPGPLQQVNQITHWLDGSMIYGSSESTTKSLRLYEGGRLKSLIGDDGKDQLLINPNAKCQGPSGTCALAGNI